MSKLCQYLASPFISTLTVSREAVVRMAYIINSTMPFYVRLFDTALLPHDFTVILHTETRARVSSTGAIIDMHYAGISREHIRRVAESTRQRRGAEQVFACSRACMFLRHPLLLRWRCLVCCGRWAFIALWAWHAGNLYSRGAVPNEYYELLRS